MTSCTPYWQIPVHCFVRLLFSARMAARMDVCGCACVTGSKVRDLQRVLHGACAVLCCAVLDAAATVQLEKAHATHRFKEATGKSVELLEREKADRAQLQYTNQAQACSCILILLMRPACVHPQVYIKALLARCPW